VAENRRTATRHEVDLPITLVMNGVTTEKRCVNLSLGGALIGMKRLPMGERVTVTFAVPTMEEPINTGAVVRWSTDDAVGVQFDGLRAKDVWALNKYFEQLQSA
jgi:hypothetical protein